MNDERHVHVAARRKGAQQVQRSVVDLEPVGRQTYDALRQRLSLFMQYRQIRAGSVKPYLS